MKKTILFLALLITTVANLQSQVSSSSKNSVDTGAINALQSQIDALVAANNTLLASFNREDEILSFASGKQDNTTTLQNRNCTVTKISTGRYQVLFDSPHPDNNNYEVCFGVVEDANRDVAKPWVEDTTENSLGFIARTTVDDNGSTGDIPRDDKFSFDVKYTKKILTDATN